MKRLFLLINLFFPIFLFAQSRPVNEDWLKMDHSNFLNLMKVILSEDNNINFYRDNIKSLHLRENKNIGFGSKRYYWPQYGGYISNHLEIFTIDNEIFYCLISTEVEMMDTLAQRDTVVAKLLNQYWKKITIIYDPDLKSNYDHQIYEFKYINDTLFEKYQNRLKSELGEFKQLEISSRLQKYYNLLTSPFEDYDFGYECYYECAPPEGRISIKKMKGSNPEIIRNIIRGYNPEGRIYGIEALLELANNNKLKLTSDDIKLIKKVINLDIPISNCNCAMGSDILAKDMFKQEEFQKILKKLNINIE